MRSRDLGALGPYRTSRKDRLRGVVERVGREEETEGEYGRGERKPSARTKDPVTQSLTTLDDLYTHLLPAQVSRNLPRRPFSVGARVGSSPTLRNKSSCLDRQPSFVWVFIYNPRSRVPLTTNLHLSVQVAPCLVTPVLVRFPHRQRFLGTVRVRRQPKELPFL